MLGPLALATLFFALSSCDAQCHPNSCLVISKCRETLSEHGLTANYGQLEKCGFKGNYPLVCCTLNSPHVRPPSAYTSSSTTTSTSTQRSAPRPTATSSSATARPAASYATTKRTTARPPVASQNSQTPGSNSRPQTAPPRTSNAPYPTTQATVRRPAPATSPSAGVYNSQNGKGPSALLHREPLQTGVRVGEHHGVGAKVTNNQSTDFPAGFNQVNSSSGGPISYEQQMRQQQGNKATRDLMRHPNLKLLPVGKCGRNAAETTERVRIGFERANLGEYPWVVQLGELRGDHFRHTCGGSVISKRYILTAGNCIRPELTWARLGEYDSSTEPDCFRGRLDDCAESVVDIKISETIKHPRYNKPYSQNDIGLVRLERSLPHLFTSYIRPVCIPLKSEVQVENNQARTKLITVGWGLTNAVAKPYSEVLQAAELPLITNRECGSLQVKSLHRNIADTQLCTNSSDYRSTACQGDIGGPLMLLTYGYGAQSETPVYMQVGVVSHGPDECGIQSAPAISTRVSSYAEWILDTIHE